MAKANPDSVFSLASRLANRMNSLDLSQERIDEVMKSGDPFWPRFDAAILNIDSGVMKDLENRVTTRTKDTEAQIKAWEKFYSEFFSLDFKFDAALIPQRQSGFNRLIIIPQGMSISKAFAACKQHFKCWKHTDEDLESVMRESERGPVKETTSRWFRDRVEADEEVQGKSANDLECEKIEGITLLERIIFELKYWSETKKHLDVSNVTLCSGSRCSGGSVPYAYWYVDEFSVRWDDADSRNSILRSRVAVG